MAESRQKKAKLNIATSLLSQFVTLICGLIVPRLMIGTFGSEVYGATASIAQFLSYITLLEGGIGGVARAALYKPLADNDILAISKVQSEIQRFFRVVGYFFTVYVLIIAVSFKYIAHTDVLDWTTSFLLVLVISISTFGQYFIGISNAVLLQAAQKTYIPQLLNSLTVILNTIGTVVLVKLNCNIITVKLVSSCIFILRPVGLWIYVKRSYKLMPCKKTEEIQLKQKWVGLGQHLAFYLHSHTDIAVLTIFADLKAVAIYSVYNMVVAHMQNLAASFSTGMEALFGDMLAKEEYEKLHKTFSYYETLISVVSITLFSVCAVLIVPFVRIYTQGVADANYIQPLFGFLMILAAVLYCLRIPYHSVVIAAGHFKQTSWAAYGEAAVNIVLSVVLVNWLGLCGVIIATVVATAFRFGYYVIYLSRNIIKRSVWLFVKRESVNVAAFIATFIVGSFAVAKLEMGNYLQWAIGGVTVTVIALAIVSALNIIVYGNDLKHIRQRKKKTVE